MSEIVIGEWCEKGHTDFVGESDYGVCGSHYKAKIVVSLQWGEGGRGRDDYTDEQILAEVAERLEGVTGGYEQAFGWGDDS